MIHNAHNRRLARQLFHLVMPLKKTLYTTKYKANFSNMAQFCVQQTWCLFHFPLWRVKIRSVPKPIILQQCLALIKICHYTIVLMTPQKCWHLNTSQNSSVWPDISRQSNINSCGLWFHFKGRNCCILFHSFTTKQISINLSLADSIARLSIITEYEKWEQV